MAKKRYYSEMYAGEKGKSAQESRDSGMISGGGFAGLPQNAIQKAWPSVGYNMPEGLNDTISGIDRQMRDDMKGKKPINSEKY